MRLTYKYENSSGYGSVKLKNLPPDPFIDKLSYLDDAWEEQRNKLGQLEDVEEELGIDLLTLFKALKNGIYAKGKNNNLIPLLEYERPSLDFDENEQTWCFILNEGFSKLLSHHYIYLKDYGKTWALTKEELL